MNNKKNISEMTLKEVKAEIEKGENPDFIYEVLAYMAGDSNLVNRIIKILNLLGIKLPEKK